MPRARAPGVTRRGHAGGGEQDALPGRDPGGLVPVACAILARIAWRNWRRARKLLSARALPPIAALAHDRPYPEPQGARAVVLADLMHSVDSLRLAERLDRFAAEAGRVLPVLLEVNVSGEEPSSALPPGDESRPTASGGASRRAGGAGPSGSARADDHGPHRGQARAGAAGVPPPAQLRERLRAALRFQPTGTSCPWA